MNFANTRNERSLNVLVTGAAGFIGANLTKLLLEQGREVVAVDRLSTYYSTEYKRWRFESLTHGATPLIEVDLASWPFPSVLVRQYDAIVHLAAQPGVRLGLEHSAGYVSDNISAHLNMLRFALDFQPKTFLYASSSSVYGKDATPPFSEKEKSLTPLSIYATTKLHNENVAGIFEPKIEGEICGLRFFSVYGSWGRPDMAYWQIARSLRTKTPFHLFGDGSVVRDFTHISDVVTSIAALLESNADGSLPRVVNIGGQQSRSMREVISIMQESFGRELIIEELPALREDPLLTMADPNLLSTLVSATPEVTLEKGLAGFTQWYMSEAKRRGRVWDQQGL